MYRMHATVSLVWVALSPARAADYVDARRQAARRSSHRASRPALRLLAREERARRLSQRGHRCRVDRVEWVVQHLFQERPSLLAQRRARERVEVRRLYDVAVLVH